MGWSIGVRLGGGARQHIRRCGTRCLGMVARCSRRALAALDPCRAGQGSPPALALPGFSANGRCPAPGQRCHAALPCGAAHISIHVGQGTALVFVPTRVL